MPRRHGVSDDDPVEHVVAQSGTPQLRATGADPRAQRVGRFASVAPAPSTGIQRRLRRPVALLPDVSGGRLDVAEAAG
jgi:hypothetical protein